MNSMERAILFLGLTVLAIAAATRSSQSTEMGLQAGDTGGCPSGTVLFSIMDSDGIYKPICYPADGGR